MYNEKINFVQNRDNDDIIEFRKKCSKYKKFEDTINDEYECDIISFDEVRIKKEKMSESLKNSVLKIHPYAISAGKGKDKRWFTSIKKGANRVIIKKNTYNEIIEELINVYGLRDDKITLRNLYPRWIKYKLDLGASSSYIRRIHADWNKYYLSDKIIDRDLKNITVNEIRAWLGSFISQNELKSKQFYNMQTIFKQIVEFAYDDELIEENYFKKIIFPRVKFFKGEKSKIKRIAISEKEVFNEKDITKIKEIALKEFEANKKYTTATAPLGVLLLFQTGLRVGELVALRERNLDDNYIYIDGEEQRQYDISINNKGEVVCEYIGTCVGPAKTDASYRKVPLTKEAKKIIELIKKTNIENGFKTEDFLFVNANQRMQENTILKHIYKYCDKAFIEKRSPHKIRKTFASLLINRGYLDISEVAQILGHVDEKTLINHYLYSTKDSSTRLSRIENSLVV